ncbi:MAG TPA: agmatinase family protein, partial [Thermoanaerobaculia bacterium]|nr:agmatinase family protein [Thermoanaerobaculia bacterium]
MSTRFDPMTFDPDAAAPAESGLFGLPFSPEDSRVVVVPVPFEATTSYGGGTSRGPAAMLEASRQIDLYDHETGEPYRRGIAMLPIPAEVEEWGASAKRLAGPVIEAGGPGDDPALRKAVGAVNALSEKMNGWVYAETSRWLDAGRMPVVLGGDHSVPFGAIRAWAERHPGLGILHLDAHADLRAAFEGFTWSHASIFHNVMTRIPEVGKLVQVGLRDLGRSEKQMIDASGGRIVPFYDSDLAAEKERGTGWAELADRIVAALPPTVYLSWDIDGLDPTLCPSTGTPVPGGLGWNEAIGLLRALIRGNRRIVG